MIFIKMALVWFIATRELNFKMDAWKLVNTLTTQVHVLNGYVFQSIEMAEYKETKQNRSKENNQVNENGNLPDYLCMSKD